MNLSTSFRVLPFRVKMLSVWLNHTYFVLCVLIWRPMLAAARSRLCSRISAWSCCIFQERYIIDVVIVGNCFLGYLLFLSFVSFETVFFDFIESRGNKEWQAWCTQRGTRQSLEDDKHGLFKEYHKTSSKRFTKTPMVMF